MHHELVLVADGVLAVGAHVEVLAHAAAEALPGLDLAAARVAGAGEGRRVLIRQPHPCKTSVGRPGSATKARMHPPPGCAQGTAQNACHEAKFPNVTSQGQPADWPARMQGQAWQGSWERGPPHRVVQVVQHHHAAVLRAAHAVELVVVALAQRQERLRGRGVHASAN